MKSIVCTMLMLSFFQCASFADERPNVVVYLLDDADSTLMQATPRLQAIAQRGMRFNATVPSPLCAPSRASLLTGLFAHNTGIYDNGDENDAIWQSRHAGHLVSDWFRGAGYRTIYAGKGLNGVSTLSTSFDVMIRPTSPKKDPYWLDKLTQSAIAAAPSDAEHPIFLNFWPKSPHGPFIPSPTYEGKYANAPFPSVASFNEADVSDKVQQLPPLTPGLIGKIQAKYRTRREMMESIADSLEALIAHFSRLSRPTVLVITSDHGYFAGQHRIPGGKKRHYEEAVQVPLYVIAPDVRPGESDALVYHLDLVPTIAEMARVEIPEVDGRSLVPLLHDPDRPWRRRVLLEYGYFRGVRTKRVKAVIHDSTAEDGLTGRRELYRLREDPFELRNRCKPNELTCGDRVLALLPQMLTCRGEACWRLETAPSAPARAVGNGSTTARRTAAQRGSRPDRRRARRESAIVPNAVGSTS